VRRLRYDELLRRTRSEPEEERLARPSGAFRRRTRVIVPAFAFEAVGRFGSSYWRRRGGD
jgi:hypothetical protein